MRCHKYRHNPVWMKVKEWLASGAIGRWHLAEFSVYRTTADPGRVADGTPWRGTSAAGRGGVLLDHGTHLVYQLLDIAGMPASVSAWTGRLRHARYEVEDTASLRFDYPGRLVTMFFTWAARARENRIRFVCDEGAIEWTGSELRLERAGRRGGGGGLCVGGSPWCRAWGACERGGGGASRWGWRRSPRRSGERTRSPSPVSPSTS